MTDKQYADSKIVPGPGEYKYLTQGTLQLGKQSIVFVIFTNDDSRDIEASGIHHGQEGGCAGELEFLTRMVQRRRPTVAGCRHVGTIDHMSDPSDVTFDEEDIR